MTTTKTRTKQSRAKGRPKMSEAEKARRTATREAAVAALGDKLTDAVVSLATSEGWTATIRAMASLDLRRYSFRNWLLILQQCPHATAVASYDEWQRQGRQVRRGEKSLTIFAGMTIKKRDEDGKPATDEDGKPETFTRFRTTPVFDISQTDPIEDATAAPLVTIGAKVTGAVPDGLWAALTLHAERRGYTVALADTSPADGSTNPATRQILISDTDPGAHATVTLAHEVGHVECGHVEDMAEYAKHRGRMETEAEAVAAIVCAWFGLDSGISSAPYIAGWAGKTPEEIKTTMLSVLQKVTAAVSAVLDSIDPPAADDAGGQEQQAEAEQAAEQSTEPEPAAALTAPAAPTVARLRPVGPVEEFTRAVTFDGYEGFGGTVRFRSNHASCAYVVTDHTGAPVPVGDVDEDQAVELLARHYGLPAPVVVLRERPHATAAPGRPTLAA
ncbi:ssDNA-binding domain-containing protein [Kitasatospora sp. RB6PN24]|uniref:ArdC-like ssDNA-binding domain-containing protein n=1 Tax=Kitasatospora humi TaxID=2893891 RepID=UPI001E517AE0|nr:ArdC-like ssDNA-binding domain-containing protein [Kitasatospora humi]MCC9309883.1 ssDNA-binding domain-containing protein [Kitasatospora humi]